MDGQPGFMKDVEMLMACPVHGNASKFWFFMEMELQRAHAYAFWCYSNLINMANNAKSLQEKGYYQ